MSVVVWITEGTWPACVDAARTRAAPDEEIELLYVLDDSVAETAHGAFAGLLGRGRPGRDPGTALERLAAESSQALLTAAAERLGRPCAFLERHGRTEREVVDAAREAALLVCARDGDAARLGPHSLGPATRFVVDHAPCPVLLVWPGEAPDTALPPHPPHHRSPHHPPHRPPPPPPPGELPGPPPPPGATHS